MVFNFRNCLYSSLGFHLAILLIFALFSGDGGIRKPFVVFGAHSKKNYHTMYKNGKLRSGFGSNVPFDSAHALSGRNNILKGAARSGRLSRASKKGCVNVKSLKHGNPKLSASKLKAMRQKLAEARAVKRLVKTKKIEAVLNKNNKTSDRPIISELSDKKKKLTVAQIKKQKELEELAEIELTQKRKKQEMLNEKKQLAELEKIDKQVKKNIERELSLKKAEKEEEKLSAEAEKIDKKSDDPKNDEDNNSASNLNETETVTNELEDSNIDYDLLDINETTSTLVLSLNGNVDPEMTLYQKCIQYEVERLWKPPLGVPRGTTCRISFNVDGKGCVKHFEISKRSEVLIYDLSILRIAHLFKFDKKLWGKNFTIDFCQ